MAEYVEREKVLSKAAPVEGCFSGMISAYDVVMLPAADVAPVRHGRWILGYVEPGYFTPGGNRPWICSECEKVISWMLGEPLENYCPNCGAKMDGGAD